MSGIVLMLITSPVDTTTFFPPVITVLGCTEPTLVVASFAKPGATVSISAVRTVMSTLPRILTSGPIEPTDVTARDSAPETMLALGTMTVLLST
jgi:hypothetical protein